MADPFVVTALAFFHVFFAMLWLGGSFTFATVMGPPLQSLPPSALREFAIRKSITVNRIRAKPGEQVAAS